MSLSYLAQYGSDSDESDQEEVEETPIQKRPTPTSATKEPEAEPKKKKQRVKEVNVDDLFGDTSVKTVKTPSHSSYRAKWLSDAEKQEETSSRSQSQQHQTSPVSPALLPPQLRSSNRRNIITEDYESWSSSKKASSERKETK